MITRYYVYDWRGKLVYTSDKSSEVDDYIEFSAPHGKYTVHDKKVNFRYTRFAR